MDDESFTRSTNNIANTIKGLQSMQHEEPWLLNSLNIVTEYIENKNEIKWYCQQF